MNTENKRLALGFLLLIWLSLSAVRLTGPLDLMDKDRDQEKPSAYVVDMLRNEQWLVQHDAFGDVTSKPPLYTWLAGGVTALAGGEISRFSMAVPCLLSVFGAVLIIYFWSAPAFGASAAFWAALLYLLSNTTYRQLALLRTDPLFTLLILAALWSAYELWRQRTAARCLGFWLLAALATLTKGPLGPLLAAGGWLTTRWRSEHTGRPALLPWHAAGLALFAALCFGWFALGYWAEGQPLIDRMIGRELAGHSVGGFKIATVYEPLFFIITRFLPWSLLGFAGLYRVFRHPPEDASARALERYLAGFFLFGLVIFSLASHKRMELYYPLLPALAILGGRELVRLAPVLSGPRRAAWAVGLALAAIAVFVATEHAGRAAKPENESAAAIRDLALELRSEFGAEFPYTHAFSPYTFQFFHNTMRPTPGLAHGFEMLRRMLPEERAYYLTVDNRSAAGIDAAMSELGLPPLHTVARAEGDTMFGFRILSNRDTLALAPRTVTFLHGLYAYLDHVVPLRLDRHRLIFEASGPGAAVTLENTENRARTVLVEFRDGSGHVLELVEARIEPGQQTVIQTDAASALR